MSRTAILVDSGCDPTDQLKEQHDFHIQPLKFYLDGEDHLDGRDEDVDLFYSRIKQTRDFYTEPPLMWDILDSFERLRDEGYSNIIDIHMSKSLSKIYELSNTAKKHTSGVTINTIDTQSAAGGARLITLKIIELIRKGLSYSEIEASLPDIRESAFVQFTVPTINYLVKNGRIGRAKAFAANLFSLKPVLAIDQGVITPVSKEKGVGRACKVIINNAVSFLSQRPHNVSLSFSYGLEENLPDLEKLKEKFMEKFQPLGISDYTMLPDTPLRPTIGCHSGPETLGIAVYGEKSPIG